MKKVILVPFLLLFLFAGNYHATGQTTSRPSSWGVKVSSKYLNNLYRVNSYIYRSEQPSKEAFAELCALGIKSTLNLRTTETDDELIGNTPIKPYLVTMDAGSFTDKEIIAALKVIKNAPKPILIHCRHGSDRTGVVVAMYRIVFQGWTKEEALNELLEGGYGFHSNYENIPDYIRDVDIQSIKNSVLTEKLQETEPSIVNPL